VRSLQVPEAPFEGRLDQIRPGAGPASVPGWAGYAAGVGWALAQEFPAAAGGFDAVLDGYVPLGSGLSSSAAMECAVAIALDELCDLGLAGSDVGRARLVAVCMRAENDIVGAPTGGLDQSASLRCQEASALLLDCRDFSVAQVPFDLSAEGLELLVIDTRAHHALADGQYAKRRADCERAAEALSLASLRDLAPVDFPAAERSLREQITDPDEARRVVGRVRHVVTEIARARLFVDLLLSGRIRETGPALNGSHDSLRVDYEVSCVELDLAVETARAAGAIGARMTGGGFGGSAIALVEQTSVEQIAAAVDAAFERNQLGRPAFLRATPSAPAHRVS
jgi:galactokinase